jgi:RimJ/RimL family protein N-acetyltransferase
VIRLSIGDSEYDAKLADWTVTRIKGLGFANGRPLDPCTCIGVLRDEQMIAAVVYHNWLPQWGHIQMTMAADDPRWCTRGVVLALLGYPFSIGCHRINVMTLAKNARVNKMLKGFGFVREGTHVGYFGPRMNAISWRMLKEDFGRLSRKFGRDEVVEVDGQRRQGRKQSEAA